MTESSQSDLNPSSSSRLEELKPSLNARAVRASTPEEPIGLEEIQLDEVRTGVATAVTEPPAAKPLSKKEQKAKSKAEQRQAKEQAKADKLEAKAQAKRDKVQAKEDKIQAKKDAIAQKATDQANRKAAKAAAKQAKKEQRKKSLLYRSSGLLFKLLGLGLAGSLAAVGGITVASFIAAPPSEEAPLLERGLEGTSDGFSATQRLPKRILTGIANRIDPDPKPIVAATAPILTEAQQRQLVAEANALRQEIAQLNQRTSLVEQQLGYDYSAGELEQRLAAIAQTLADPSTGPQVAVSSPSRPEPLVMTLPTDPLFDDEQSALKPGANTLLVTLLGEMRAYENAIVTVSVHTDDVGSPEAQRDLSLRRAQVVSNYLRAQVGDRQERFTWNPVGAGSTQSLVANDSNENRQRNRRIEISVTPQ